MSNTEHERPPATPSEQRKETKKPKKEKEKRKEEKGKGEKEKHSEEEAKKSSKEAKREVAEKTAAAMAQAVEKTELLAEKQERLITTVDRLIDRGEDLTLVFEQLSSAIKEGVIKDFKQLSRVIERFGKGIKEAESRITKSTERVQESFGKTAEYSDRVVKAQKESAELIGKHTEDLEKAYQGMREAAEAAEAAGIGIGPPGERRLHRRGREEDDRNWFEAQLRRLEEEDRSFADNWRRTWPLEQYLASIPPEEREFYKELSQKFEDRRRLHDYQWLYQRASGVEAIINASTILPAGATERTLRQKGVAESMVKLQGLAEKTVEARRAGEEEREAELKSRILRLMRGEVDIDEEGNEIEVDEDQAAINRLGGRLFVVLGFTASYDFSEFAGGDFFAARLMHLKQRFKDRAKKEGNPWFGRDKLWENFPVEIFGNNFAGGVLANLPEHKNKEDPFFKRFGLELKEEDEEDEAGRKLRVLKIRDPEKFRGLELKEIDILQENYLTTIYADALLKADEARKAFLKPDQYLDRPTVENFLMLSNTVEHLRGERRWAFFAPLADGLIKFHKGLGILERVTKGKFFETLKAVDPVTGKERIKGVSWVGSDAANLGLDQDWRAGEIHRFVNTLQRDNLVDRSRAEGLLRRNLDVFRIPGIGPVRFTKEMWDAVGWGGLLLALLAPFYEFFARLKKELERS